MGSEKFCLKWNDFESNISASFKELRHDSELFDLTLACEDDHLSAHKVILSACSSFFRNILRRTKNHQNLLLYLKGVSAKEMECVLNFMYHGEVSVAQNDLNSFLQVAEDLQVKGLTQNNSNSGGAAKPTSHQSQPKKESRSFTSKSAPVQQSSNSYRSQSHSQSYNTHQEDDIQEITPVVKTEVPNNTGGEMYDQVDTGVGTVAEYDDNTYAEYDTGYTDQEYDTSLMDQEAGGISDDKIQCGICSKFYHKMSIRRHIRNQHGDAEQASCHICNITYKNDDVLKDHMRRKHNTYQTNTF